MIPMIWRSVAMIGCFLAALAEPALWIVAVVLILGLMVGHFWESMR